MKQAVYEVSNQGHFGLASEGYVHFTSPIRRYPDVVVHRAVKAVLRKERVDRSEPAMERMRLAATTASERERRAMTIERQVVDLHRALVMRDRLGEIFGGTVGGLSMAGAYVAIDEPFVDVMVRTETLGNEAFELDEHGLALVATRSGDRVELGDAMMVQIEDVNITRRTVFGRRLRDEASDEAPNRRARRGGRVVETAGPATERAATREVREQRRKAAGEKRVVRRSGSSGPSSEAAPTPDRGRQAKPGKSSGKSADKPGKPAGRKAAKGKPALSRSGGGGKASPKKGGKRRG
jgi:ribonuclease R